MTRPRLNSLRRLKDLYALQERQYFLELQKSNGEVGRVSKAIDVETELMRSSTLKGSRAVTAQDRAEAIITAATFQFAMHRRSALEQLLRDRKEQLRAVRERYLASRIRHEKVEVLLHIAEDQARMEQEKKEQSAVADGFVSRGHWNQKRNEPDIFNKTDLMK